jgi:hypothetical protein
MPRYKIDVPLIATTEVVADSWKEALSKLDDAPLENIERWEATHPILVDVFYDHPEPPEEVE